ncbi:MAG: CDP-alcohol phosphatidyltransferase family protein [Chloroflexi bacterium]|nr:CDP-alcohol phosphatidyltransferase family protein [Chloroflexota bacterium]
MAEFLARYRWVTPNRVSFASFLLGGIAAAVCVLILPLWTAGVFVALGDLLDYLDGALARAQGSASREGAIFDAVLDRYIDFLVIGALTFLTAVILNPQRDLFIEKMTFMTSETALLLGMAALLGSALTPYIRAKTEAEGKKSIPTIGDRGWRNRILVVGLIAGQPLWTLAAIAAVTNFSAIRRLIFAMGKG